MTAIIVKYDIGARVLITDLERQKATIQSIHVGTKGITYEVAWFASGQRYTSYLFDHELEAAE